MLKRIWSNWRRFGQWLGDQVARAFLVGFYFTVALPFGLLVRLTQDPLDILKDSSVIWTKHQAKDITVADARRLF